MGLLNLEDESGDICTELVFYVNGKKVGVIARQNICNKF